MSSLWTVSEIVAATGGRPEGLSDGPISSISIDSREIAPEALFVAIKGDTHDGHDFVANALAAGASAALVSDAFHAARGGQQLIVVPDPLRRSKNWPRRRGPEPRDDCCGDGERRKDHDKGSNSHGAERCRRDARVDQELQQSLGRTLDGRPDAAGGTLRRVRNRHEPCWRDNSAGEAGSSAYRGDHYGRRGASAVLQFDLRDRPRQG